MRTARYLVLALTVTLLTAWGLGPTFDASGETPAFHVDQVYYGYGWLRDPDSGLTRSVAYLNLTETAMTNVTDTGHLEAFSQILVRFSAPRNASGSENGSGLVLLFSYYTAAQCLGLNATTCPLGENQTAIAHDTFSLEIRRILEFRDANGDGRYEAGEAVLHEVPFNQASASDVSLGAEGPDGSAVPLPYPGSLHADDVNTTYGAIQPGDGIFEKVRDFRISLGSGPPGNFSVDSYLYLAPDSYKGIPLTPSELKLDFRMANLSYAGNDTRVALELNLTSTQFALTANLTGSSERLLTNASAAEAFFSWGRNATLADGTSGPVRSTIVPHNDTWTSVYLAYPRSPSLLHDPVLGLEGPIISGGASPGPTAPPPSMPPDILAQLLLLTAAAAAILVALLVVLQSRRRR